MNILDYRRAEIDAPARKRNWPALTSLALAVPLFLMVMPGLLARELMDRRDYVQGIAPLWLAGTSICAVLIAYVLSRPVTRDTGSRRPARWSLAMLMLSLLMLILAHLLASI